MEKAMEIMIIICFLFTIFLAIIVVKDYIDLKRFINCYDNNFKEEYCEKYRNY